VGFLLRLLLALLAGRLLLAAVRALSRGARLAATRRDSEPGPRKPPAAEIIDAEFEDLGETKR
jgi:hypothetical protein